MSSKNQLALQKINLIFLKDQMNATNKNNIKDYLKTEDYEIDNVVIVTIVVIVMNRKT